MRRESPTATPPVPPPRLDRTTLIVRLGLVVLALTGLATIFGESLLLGPGAGDLARPTPGPGR